MNLFWNYQKIRLLFMQNPIVDFPLKSGSFFAPLDMIQFFPHLGAQRKIQPAAPAHSISKFLKDVWLCLLSWLCKSVPLQDFPMKSGSFLAPLDKIQLFPHFGAQRKSQPAAPAHWILKFLKDVSSKLQRVLRTQIKSCEPPVHWILGVFTDRMS